MTARKQPAQILTVIRRIRKQADELAHRIPADNELADATGLMREIEVSLGDTRRKWERMTTEMEPVIDHDKTRRVNPTDRNQSKPVVVGKQYELVPQFKNVRTYNLPAILAATADTMDVPVGVGLTALATYGAVKVSVQWTKLQQFCHEIGVPLRVQKDTRVDDADGLDGAMVGTVRVENGVKRVPLK